MEICLSNVGLTKLLLPLLMDAESVIMYRSSPAQKAEIVKLIKTQAKGKKTLAIGDGAKD